MKVAIYPKATVEPRSRAGDAPGDRADRKASFAELVAGPPCSGGAKAQLASPAPGRSRDRRTPVSADGNATLPVPNRKMIDAGGAVQAAAPIIPAPAVGGAHGARPARGFQFDELGMFGHFGAIRAPAMLQDVYNEPANVALSLSAVGDGRGGDDGAIASTNTDFAAGAMLLVRAPIGSPPMLGAAPADAGEPVSIGPTLSSKAPVESPAFPDAADDGEAEPARLGGRPPNAARREGAEALKIVLHDGGEGVVLAAAAPLAPAEQARVWRSIRDYAAQLGLELRDFHLNGWAGGSPYLSRGDQNGR